MKATKNITLNASQNYNLTTGNNMSTNVGNNVVIAIINKDTYDSGDYTETVRGNKKVVVTGDFKETTGSYSHNAIKGDALITSTGVSKVIGKEDAIVNKGYFEKEANESERVSQQGKNRKLAVKTIECVEDLEIGYLSNGKKGKKKGGINGKTYTFRVSEYLADIPTEEEKKNITWEFFYIDEYGAITAGSPQKSCGDTFVFHTDEHDIKSDSIEIRAYFNHHQKNKEGFKRLYIYNNTGWFKDTINGDILWMKEPKGNNYRFLGKDNRSVVLDLFETDEKEDRTTDIGTVELVMSDNSTASVNMSAETIMKITMQADVKTKGDIKCFNGVTLFCTILCNPRDHQEQNFGVFHMLVNNLPMSKHEVGPNEIVPKYDKITTFIYKMYLPASDIKSKFKSEKINLVFDLKGQYGTLGHMGIGAIIPNITSIEIPIGFENK